MQYFKLYMQKVSFALTLGHLMDDAAFVPYPSRNVFRYSGAGIMIHSDENNWTWYYVPRNVSHLLQRETAYVFKTAEALESALMQELDIGAISPQAHEELLKLFV